MNQSDKASILYVFIYITFLGWMEDNKVLLLKKNRQLIYCLSHQGSKEQNNNKTMEIDALVPLPNATEDKVYSLQLITSHILRDLQAHVCLYIS